MESKVIYTAGQLNELLKKYEFVSKLCSLNQKWNPLTKKWMIWNECRSIDTEKSDITPAMESAIQQFDSQVSAYMDSHFPEQSLSVKEVFADHFKSIEELN